MKVNLSSGRDTRGNYGTPSAYRGQSPHKARRTKRKRGVKA